MWCGRRISCSRTGISAEANLAAGRRSQQEPISQQDGMGGGGAREVVSAEEEGIVLSRGSSSQLADAGPHSSCLPWWLVSS